MNLFEFKAIAIIIHLIGTILISLTIIRLAVILRALIDKGNEKISEKLLFVRNSSFMVLGGVSFIVLSIVVVFSFLFDLQAGIRQELRLIATAINLICTSLAFYGSLSFYMQAKKRCDENAK